VDSFTTEVVLLKKLGENEVFGSSLRIIAYQILFSDLANVSTKSASSAC
jgi:hypothetical protein